MPWALQQLLLANSWAHLSPASRQSNCQCQSSILSKSDNLPVSRYSCACKTFAIALNTMDSGLLTCWKKWWCVQFRSASKQQREYLNIKLNRLNCCKKLPSNWLDLAVAVRCPSFSSKSPLLTRKLEILFCTWVIRGWKNMAITHLPSLRWSSHESCASSLKCKTILVPLCSPKNCSSGASTIL